MFTHDETIQIINPEHHIATLTSDDAVRDGNDQIANGRGYRTSDENAGEGTPRSVSFPSTAVFAGRTREVRH